MPDFGFSHIPGNEGVKKYLSALVMGKNVPQSVIITGEEGVGKLALAEQFALALLCENPTEEGACGKCSSCRAYGDGNNPNIAYWYPKGQNTTIDQMRTLKELSGYTPAKGRYKINIIEKGDTLNEEASNSILKIIEEPPEYLVNILIYNNPHNILQTIRSRSITVGMSPVSREILEEYLKKKSDLDDKTVSFASFLAMGSVGKAREFLENDKREELRKLIFDCVRGVTSKPMDLLYLADMIADKKNYYSDTGRPDADEIKQSPRNYFFAPVECEITQMQAVLNFLDILALVFRDIIVCRCGSENIINTDRREETEKLSGKISEEKAGEAIRIIWKTKDKIRSNVNMTIALQSMLCRLLISLREK